MLWQDLEIELEYVQKIYERVEYISPVIAGYIERAENDRLIRVPTPNMMYPDSSKPLSQRVYECSRLWFFEHYWIQRVKDLQKINLCKSKFCPNCQKTMQASRLLRFGPVLNEIAQEYDLYHITHTIPNVSAENLSAGIDTLFKVYKRFHEYLSGKIRIKGLNFDQYGYKGSLRALEVTYNSEKAFLGQEYHPHLHSIIALKKGITFDGENINKFSYRRGKLDRSFSNFAVQLQKIFYLIANDEKVTIEKINTLELGYNSVLVKVEQDKYYEIFKYAVKGFSQDKKIMTYDQFITLYFAMRKRRTIQGYGVFYNFKPDDTIDESMNEEYNAYIERLKYIEDPVNTSQTIEQVNDALQRGFCLYISRKSIHKLQRQIELHEGKLMIE